ncbi:unnamed protein product [Linum tenue]|uniref:Uncharacterized protein n=1 Tax=Linum tenue TaxID=586396 RepID=A0AAV0RVT7_9ROSI|nr:unnamed protein product [Linum tenue]
MAMKKETRDESGVMASWDLNSVDPCYLEHGRLLPRRLYHGAAYMIQLYRLCYFMQATELALQCTQSHPALLPKISEVLKVLEGLVGAVRRRGATSWRVECPTRQGLSVPRGTKVISMKLLRSSLKQWSFQDQDD